MAEATATGIGQGVGANRSCIVQPTPRDTGPPGHMNPISGGCLVAVRDRIATRAAPFDRHPVRGLHQAVATSERLGVRWESGLLHEIVTIQTDTSPGKISVVDKLLKG